MKRKNRTAIVLFNLSRFFSFFFVIALVITSSMMIFLRDLPLTRELIQKNAIATLLNTVFMTLIGCGIDSVRRNLVVDRPLRHILNALNEITRGNYSVRLELRDHNYYHAGFYEIGLGVNQLAQELSGVETLRTDFISNVSHEMKTPLSIVQNYTTLLRDPTLSQEKQEEYLSVISQTVRRLADLVSNILKLNKLENQQIFPEVQPFDLTEQLCESLLEFESAWEAKRIELECDLAEDVWVSADPELLRLVWSNLFSNAIKFTPEGGIISLKLSQEDGWACVSVSDTGCGMTKETGAHIFEKFYQGDTAHATQGNGLGLALVKRVVDITGGMISVSSTPGKGSTFAVRLRRIEHGTV